MRLGRMQTTAGWRPRASTTSDIASVRSSCANSTPRRSKPGRDTRAHHNRAVPPSQAAALRCRESRPSVRRSGGATHNRVCPQCGTPAVGIWCDGCGSTSSSKPSCRPAMRTKRSRGSRARSASAGRSRRGSVSRSCWKGGKSESAGKKRRRLAAERRRQTAERSVLAVGQRASRECAAPDSSHS